MNMEDVPPPPPPPPPPQSSSTVARIVSGSIGSMVYVTAFAPLEVVKIRQQAAGSGEEGGARPSSSTFRIAPRDGGGGGSRSPGATGRSTTTSTSSFKAQLRGRGAVASSNGLILPTSAFPCLVAPQYRICGRPPTPSSSSSSSSPSHSPSHRPRLFESFASSRRAFREFRRPNPVADRIAPRDDAGVYRQLMRIARNEGASGLYAGLKPTLFATVPNAAIYLSSYDEISHRLRDIGVNDDDIDGHWIPFLAGASARLVSSAATGEFPRASPSPPPQRRAFPVSRTTRNSHRPSLILTPLHNVPPSRHCHLCV
jgi:hypothetical protein